MGESIVRHINDTKDSFLLMERTQTHLTVPGFLQKNHVELVPWIRVFLKLVDRMLLRAHQCVHTIIVVP